MDHPFYTALWLSCNNPLSLQHVLNGCIMDMVVGGSEDGADNAAQQNAIKKAKV